MEWVSSDLKEFFNGYFVELTQDSLKASLFVEMNGDFDRFKAFGTFKHISCRDLPGISRSFTATTAQEVAKKIYVRLLPTYLSELEFANGLQAAYEAKVEVRKNLLNEMADILSIKPNYRDFGPDSNTISNKGKLISAFVHNNGLDVELKVLVSGEEAIEILKRLHQAN